MNKRHSLLRRLLIATVVGVVLVAPALVLAYRAAVGTPTHPLSKEQALELLASATPLTSSRSTVEKWLESQHIEYHYSNTAWPLNVGRANPEHINHLAWLNKGEFKAVDVATIYDTDRAFLTQINTVIYFFYNSNDILVTYVTDQESATR